MRTQNLFFSIFAIAISALLSSSCEKDNTVPNEKNVRTETYMYKGKEYNCKYIIINDSTLEDYSAEYTPVNSYIEEIQNKPGSGIVTLNTNNIQYLFENKAEADEFLKQFGNPMSLKSTVGSSYIDLYRHKYQTGPKITFDAYKSDWVDFASAYYYKYFSDGSPINNEISSIFISNGSSNYLVVVVYEDNLLGGHFIKFVINPYSSSDNQLANHSDNINTTDADLSNTAQTERLSLRRLKTVRKLFKKEIVSWNDQISSIEWYFTDSY